MVNRLSSRTFASTAHIKSSVITDVIMPFFEISNPFLHHSITYGIFTAYFTYLTMNICRFHIYWIQKTDNRPYFLVGGALERLEHFKRTEQCVNTIWLSRIDVCGLPMNEGRQRACAKSRPQRCGGNIKKRFLLSENASCFWNLDEVIPN
jgi:hypothetical protein